MRILYKISALKWPPNVRHCSMICHHLPPFEVLRGAGGVSASGGGIGYKRGEVCVGRRPARDLALSIPIRDSDRVGELSVAIEMEVEVIGKDYRIKRSLVAVKLLLVPRAFSTVEIAVAQIFGLHEEHTGTRLVLHDVLLEREIVLRGREFGAVGLQQLQGQAGLHEEEEDDGQEEQDVRIRGDRLGQQLEIAPDARRREVQQVEMLMTVPT